MLEIDKHQALLGHNVNKESVDQRALVSAVHEPAWLEPQDSVRVVLTIWPVVVGFAPQLLINRLPA